MSHLFEVVADVVVVIFFVIILAEVIGARFIEAFHYLRDRWNRKDDE